MSGTALSGDPASEEDFVASLYKGGELLAANKVVEAREHLEKANRLNPKNEKAQNLLGLAYFKLGLFDQASEVYEALVRENPADPTLRVNLGLVYLKTNNLERSVHEFETATDLEPTHKKAHNYLGLALAQAGDYSRARDHFVAAGSDAMAEKMARALVARVESEPPQEALTVPPAPPPSAPAIPVEASVIVSQAASQPSQPPQPPPSRPAPPPSDDEELIEVMSDEQEPPSGEMPVAVEAEELAVEVPTGESVIEAEVISEPGTTLTELPTDAQVMSRPSRPNLSATDWGEHIEARPGAVEPTARLEPVESQLVPPDDEAAELLDENQLIEASETDFPQIQVDEYGEPVTGQQFGTSSKSDLRRRAAAWPEQEERELVSVESLTPEPSAPTADVPVDNSWSAPAPGSDELMAVAAQSYVATGDVEPGATAPSTAEENDWSQSGIVTDQTSAPQVETRAEEPQWATEPRGAAAHDAQWPGQTEVDDASYRPTETQVPSEMPDWSTDPQAPTGADTAEPLEASAEAPPQWEPDPNAPPAAEPSEQPIEATVAAPDPASENDWSNVNSSTSMPSAAAALPSSLEAETASAEAAPAPVGQVPDWVAEAPDPLAAVEAPAEPEWVSQPLSEVNFTAAGHSVIAQVTVPRDAEALPRPTVPTYEPTAVTAPNHVDFDVPPEGEPHLTEPHGVEAVPVPPASVPTGYSPMGSQRLVDLGASTQWVAEGERGPFHLGTDGMAVTVHGEMLVRLTNLVAVVGSIEVKPEMRRIRGRPTEQPFGTGENQLQRVTGAGVLYLEPGRSLFHAIDLDDEGAYLREERVFAFEEPIAFENGRLTDAGKAVELVNLKGAGRVLLQLDGPLKAMPIPVGSPMVVPLTRLVGWFGRVTPRMVGLVGQGAVELTGEGYALLGAASDRS